MLLDDPRPYDLDRVFRLLITVVTLVGLFFSCATWPRS